MQRVMDEIYTWSIFNEEKKLDFNGLYLKTPGGPLLIDPPSMQEADIREVEGLGIPQKILLSNKHHTRASAQHRERWDAKIFIHEDDQPLMEIPVDGTFSDGELLSEVIEAIRIPNAKTPGECAFHWKQLGILILGDALIGDPPGSLRMLPDEKFKDPLATRQGLSVLRGLSHDRLLVGDGKSILENSRKVLEDFLNNIQL